MLGILQSKLIVSNDFYVTIPVEKRYFTLLPVLSGEITKSK